MNHPSKPTTSLGQHLVAFRKQHKLSAAAFARELELHPTSLSTLVHGKSPLYPKVALRLEWITGLAAEEWLSYWADDAVAALRSVGA